MFTPGSSEKIKRLAERLTGWARVPKDSLQSLIIERKANIFRFRDDGIVPNHPNWPMIRLALFGHIVSDVTLTLHAAVLPKTLPL